MKGKTEIIFPESIQISQYKTVFSLSVIIPSLAESVIFPTSTTYEIENRFCNYMSLILPQSPSEALGKAFVSEEHSMPSYKWDIMYAIKDRFFKYFLLL